MHHHDVFGRNGAIRLQFETPVTIRMLMIEEGIASPGNGVIKPFIKGKFKGSVS